MLSLRQAIERLSKEPKDIRFEVENNLRSREDDLLKKKIVSLHSTPFPFERTPLNDSKQPWQYHFNYQLSRGGDAVSLPKNTLAVGLPLQSGGIQRSLPSRLPPVQNYEPMIVPSPKERSIHVYNKKLFSTSETNPFLSTSGKRSSAATTAGVSAADVTAEEKTPTILSWQPSVKAPSTGRTYEDKRYGEHIYDMRHQGGEQYFDRDLERYFSEQTVDFVSNEITRRLRGVREDGKDVILTRRRIRELLDMIWNNDPNPTTDMINKAIAIASQQLINEQEMIQDNNKLDPWDAILTGDPDKGNMLPTNTFARRYNRVRPFAFRDID